MKENFLTRIFGSGERTPRVNPVSEATREIVIADAEEVMASQRPVDVWADALNSAYKRRKLESIARLRGSVYLPKEVENVFKEGVAVSLAHNLSLYGISIMLKGREYADLLWPVFKAHLLSGDAWLERADARDKSPLTEQEKTFFEKGGAK